MFVMGLTRVAADARTTMTLQLVNIFKSMQKCFGYRSKPLIKYTNYKLFIRENSPTNY